MRKLIAPILIFLLSVVSVRAANSLPNESMPDWLALTKAYATRNNSIEQYTHSDTVSTRLYAEALLDLSKREFSLLADDGQACYKKEPRDGAEATAYFGCLFAVGTGMSIAHKPKAAYIWRAKVSEFYKKYSDLINRTTGTDNPAGINDLNFPSVAMVKKWPEPIVEVKNNWSSIKLENGEVTAYIDGKPVRMLLDTGATGITLSRKDIKRYGLASKMMPLGARVTIGNNTGGYKTNSYYVAEFRLGPIEISNAYVTVAPTSNSKLPGSAVGITVLSALKKFSVSATEVSQFYGGGEDVCGRMMYTRRPVTQGYEYPMFSVPTSAGSMSLFLDSGRHGFGQVRNVGLYLAPRTTSRFTSRDGVKIIRKNVTIIHRQNGKQSSSQTRVFDLSVGGTRARAISGFINPSDPVVAGSITFNFLRKAIVSYDFPNRKMCIRA